MSRFRVVDVLVFALIVAGAGCASALPRPTESDLRWARVRWPEVTLDDLQHGRAIYVNKCAGCHNLHRPDDFEPERWTVVLAKMGKEAKLNPQEQRSVARYLSTASAGMLGRVDNR